jgi:hypothetical protein
LPIGHRSLEELAMPDWKKPELRLAGFVVAMVAGFALLSWIAGEPAENLIGPASNKSLAAAWGEAIQQFKIEPVFPPEEDLAVGDVLAYVVADKSPDPIDYRLPLTSRAVKLAHVDLRAELEKAYAELPTFPDAAKAATNDKQLQGAEPTPLPQGSVLRLFTKEVIESNLPRAAFANLKTASSNSVAGGVGAENQASASYGGSNQGYEEFQLSEVSTYGLPSARALERLSKYCAAPLTRDDCQESTVRKHLETIVGQTNTGEDRIYSKVLNVEGQAVYAIDVGIVIVSRVYLARSIVHRRRGGRAQSVGFFASLFSSNDNKADTPAREEPASNPSGSTSANATEEELKKRVDELEKQIKKMRSGGGFSIQSSTSAESAFDTGRLPRPVAFGFRFVRFEFPKTESNAEAKK